MVAAEAGLAADRALHPPATVIRPETPPTEASSQFATFPDRSNGPKMTRELITSQTTPMMSIHAPPRAHHSRSSSSVQRLMKPTRRVAASRNALRKTPRAPQAYSSVNPGRSGKNRPARYQAR